MWMLNTKKGKTKRETMYENVFSVATKNRSTRRIFNKNLSPWIRYDTRHIISTPERKKETRITIYFLWMLALGLTIIITIIRICQPKETQWTREKYTKRAVCIWYSFCHFGWFLHNNVNKCVYNKHMRPHTHTFKYINIWTQTTNNKAM